MQSNKTSKSVGNIFYRDIGEYLSREQKLSILTQLKSVSSQESKSGWQKIEPDKHGDWVNQRDDSFEKYISVGDKKGGNDPTIFANYSGGVKTGRDNWCYNSSSVALRKTMTAMIEFYNQQVEAFRSLKIIGKKPEVIKKVTKFVVSDPTRISWTDGLYSSLAAGGKAAFEPNCLSQAMYRPFVKQWLYYSKMFNERTYQMTNIFPTASLKNRVIVCTGVGAKGGFSAFITDVIPDLNIQSAGTQCFPLYLYQATKSVDGGLFQDQNEDAGYRKKDGINDAGLEHFQVAYPKETITKDDIFYYIYGILHSEEYLLKYEDNLSKELPRIPCVKTIEDFRTFAKAGRNLAELHIDYEAAKPHDVTLDAGGKKLLNLSEKEYYVTKMKFAKKEDKSTVVYNNYITIKNIPIEAYDYVVNGKSALEWVMERQGVKTDKDSGVVNDANLYATETVGNPAYPLQLFQRVITVSLETLKIVRSLPKLDIMEPKSS